MNNNHASQRVSKYYENDCRYQVSACKGTISNFCTKFGGNLDAFQIICKIRFIAKCDKKTLHTLFGPL